jgi:hypothetical protein
MAHCVRGGQTKFWDKVRDKSLLYRATSKFQGLWALNRNTHLLTSGHSLPRPQSSPVTALRRAGQPSRRMDHAVGWETWDVILR